MIAPRSVSSCELRPGYRVGLQVCGSQAIGRPTCRHHATCDYCDAGGFGIDRVVARHGTARGALWVHSAPCTADMVTFQLPDVLLAAVLWPPAHACAPAPAQHTSRGEGPRPTSPLRPFVPSQWPSGQWPLDASHTWRVGDHSTPPVSVVMNLDMNLTSSYLSWYHRHQNTPTNELPSSWTKPSCKPLKVYREGRSIGSRSFPGALILEEDAGVE